MTDAIEHGFRNFSNEEVRAGYDRACELCGSIDIAELRRLAAEAGSLRAKNAASDVGDLIEQVLQSYQERNRHTFSARKTDALKSAIGFMFGERTPATKAKRKKEKAEVLAASHNIDETPLLSPEVQRELFEATKAVA